MAPQQSPPAPPETAPAPPPPVRVNTVRIQRRLLAMLMTPLVVLGLLNAWVDYRDADSAASAQDRQLRQLAPLLADSIIAVGARRGDPPVLLLAQPVEEYLRERQGLVSYKIYTPRKKQLHGDTRLPFILPLSGEAEFFNQDVEGVPYRLVVQRLPSVAGDVIVAVADASDPRKLWLQQVLMKVILPNAVLIALAALGIGWVVQRALRPLHDLIAAVEHRSPRDLSNIDEHSTPAEIRPLVLALNRLFALVNAQAEKQRRFVADAAHQLRTPLAGLQAQIEAWSESIHQQHMQRSAHTASTSTTAGTNGVPAHASPPPQQGTPPGHSAELVWNASAQQDMVQIPLHELHRLRAATRRTSQLVHQLLSLSRADASMPDAQHMQPVDLPTLCTRLLEQHLDSAAQKNIDLGLDMHPATVQAHAIWLQELLGNLLVNALHYTPDGGIVTLRCGVQPATSAAAERAFVDIEDNGPGIPADERAHVFERFYRLPGATGEGTGLGLAIAREIAQRHHSELLLTDGIPHADGTGCGLKATLVFAPAPPA